MSLPVLIGYQQDFGYFEATGDETGGKPATNMRQKVTSVM